MLYRTLLPYCDEAVVTQVRADGGAQVFYENLDLLPEWELVEESAPVCDSGYTMTFCTGLRNISSGSVIASQFFPGAAIVPVMMGTLFQQVLAAIFGQVMQRLVGEERERERSRVRSARELLRRRTGR